MEIQQTRLDTSSILLLFIIIFLVGVVIIIIILNNIPPDILLVATSSSLVHEYHIYGTHACANASLKIHTNVYPWLVLLLLVHQDYYY